jgi:alpha-D-ribose 1-methylphosphonate 5-triphosphate synthase subunit PhnI
MYVAVKGGERAIDNAHAWLAEERRGDRDVAELSIAQIREQLKLAVNRVMAEGSLYDPDLAALAIKQARGDLIEAVFLIRAYRTTLPRFGASHPVDTGEMACDRRISATFKDFPGGQVLGPTFDYTHRLLDFALAAEGLEAPEAERGRARRRPDAPCHRFPRAGGPDPAGAGRRRHPPRPDARAARFSRRPAPAAAGADPGRRGVRAVDGLFHAARLRAQPSVRRRAADRAVPVEMDIPELGFSIELGEVVLTECETVNQFTGSKTEPPQFTRGYGLVFGQTERKAISMALVDRALRWEELGEDNVGAPAQDAEFVLYHSDNVQATGFLEHIKLPHYVDFQSELELIRRLRAEAMAGHAPGGRGMSLVAAPVATAVAIPVTVGASLCGRGSRGARRTAPPRCRARSR